jgi:hypothetical protein
MSGVQCYDHYFLRLLAIFEKKISVLLKTNFLCLISNHFKIAIITGENILKILHNIGPGSFQYKVDLHNIGWKWNMCWFHQGADVNGGNHEHDYTTLHFAALVANYETPFLPKF